MGIFFNRDGPQLGHNYRRAKVLNSGHAAPTSEPANPAGPNPRLSSGTALTEPTVSLTENRRLLWPPPVRHSARACPEFTENPAAVVTKASGSIWLFVELRVADFAGTQSALRPKNYRGIGLAAGLHLTAAPAFAMGATTSPHASARVNIPFHSRPVEAEVKLTTRKAWRRPL